MKHVKVKINPEKVLKLREAHRKLEKLPIISGTLIFLAFSSFLLKKETMMWVTAMEYFIIGSLFTFKVCVNKIYEQCFTISGEEKNNVPM